MNIRNNLLARLAVALACLAIGPTALAQSFPTRPITIVVAYPPGGAADIVARVLAAQLGKRLGQSVVVNNRGGAADMIGTDHVAKAAPDRYTLLMGSLPEVVINPFMYKDISYQPDKDLRPITMVATYPFLFVANPSFPTHSAKELIELARKNPGEYTYASSGIGSVQYIGMKMLTSMAGIKLRHIPYKGVGPALNDMLGNQVSMGLAGFPPAIAQVEAGKLTAIGITSKKRLPLVPNIPALSETPGLENYDFVAWLCLLAPAGTPDAIVNTLQHEVTEVLALPDVRATLEQSGMTIAGTNADEFAALLKSETARISKVIHDADIKVTDIRAA